MKFKLSVRNIEKIFYCLFFQPKKIIIVVRYEVSLCGFSGTAMQTVL